MKAIGLVSGGLDSALAVAVVRRLGVDVLALHFFNGFAPGSMKRQVLEEGMVDGQIAALGGEMSGAMGVPVDVVDVTEEFLEILVSPRYGYGANVNPCIDCRIFTLGKAKERMESEGVDFVFTGEVLGQRPMSQHRQAMDLVERRSGLEGYLLRPLSAKLLPPTIPEKEGWIRREDLYDISGRSRKRQIALAAELGVTGYSPPAGGCALTDENYARRFRDFLKSTVKGTISRREAVLLSVGRHLRLTHSVKIIVGRNREENVYLEKNWGESWLAVPVEHPGPTVLIQGEPGERELERSASITARYSDAKKLTSVRVRVAKGDIERVYEVAPADEEELRRCRI